MPSAGRLVQRTRGSLDVGLPGVSQLGGVVSSMTLTIIMGLKVFSGAGFAALYLICQRHLVLPTSLIKLPICCRPKCRICCLGRHLVVLAVSLSRKVCACESCVMAVFYMTVEKAPVRDNVTSCVRLLELVRVL